MALSLAGDFFLSRVYLFFKFPLYELSVHSQVKTNLYVILIL